MISKSSKSEIIVACVEIEKKLTHLSNIWLNNAAGSTMKKKIEIAFWGSLGDTFLFIVYSGMCVYFVFNFSKVYS